MKLSIRCFILFALMVFVGNAFASADVNSVSKASDSSTPRILSSLDDQCIIDFQDFTYGSYSGDMYWPGHVGTYRLTGFRFTTNCPPGSELFTYCMDLDHPLYENPYCVNIDDAHVRAAYPEQYPAMAYVMSWYPVNSQQDDRIMQLAIWKLTNENHCDNPDYGKPFYYINDGRGYPNIGNSPVFPYVNTVFNSDPNNNNPANDRVRLALGADDLLPKNIILEGDQYLISVEAGIINYVDSTIAVPVEITVVRGARALALGDTSCSGIKLQLHADHGTISDTVVYTNNECKARVTITQRAGLGITTILTVCSQGAWPRLITQCDMPECGTTQQQIVQAQGTGNLYRYCVPVIIPSDEWLPVELASFSANANGQSVTLNWATASETQNHHFEIARNGQAMANIPSLGNTTSGHNYTWTDSRVVAGTLYDYSLVSVDVNGNREVLGNRTVTAGLNDVSTVNDYALSQNYPNPFNPTTEIHYAMKESGFVSIKVYNPIGQLVATLVEGTVTQGHHNVQFDATNLPSGIYVYRMETNGFTAQQKMMLIK